MIDKELANLVERSKKIGADQSMVVYGGGNTSEKIDESKKEIQEEKPLILSKSNLINDESTILEKQITIKSH